MGAVGTSHGDRIDKHAKAVALNMVASRVEVARANNGGVAKYGAVTTIIEDLQPSFPWLTKNMVKYHLIKLNTQQEEEADKTATAAAILTFTSPPASFSSSGQGSGAGRTSSTFSSLTAEDRSASPGSSNEAFLQQDILDDCGERHDGGGIINDPGEQHRGNESSAQTSDEGCQERVISVRRFGRPKGSTESRSREANDCIRRATTAATKEFKDLVGNKRKSSRPKQRLARRKLTEIITRAKETYNVPDHIKI